MVSLWKPTVNTVPDGFGSLQKTANLQIVTCNNASMNSPAEIDIDPLTGSHVGAVTSMVLDPEWGQWSDYQIAKHCGVSHTMVQTVRRTCGKAATPRGGVVTRNNASQDSDSDDDFPGFADEPPTRTYIHNKSGKPTKMKVGKIGKGAGTPAKASHVDSPASGEPDTPKPSPSEPKPPIDTPAITAPGR